MAFEVDCTLLLLREWEMCLAAPEADGELTLSSACIRRAAKMVAERAALALGELSTRPRHTTPFSVPDRFPSAQDRRALSRHPVCAALRCTRVWSARLGVTAGTQHAGLVQQRSWHHGRRNKSTNVNRTLRPDGVRCRFRSCVTSRCDLAQPPLREKTRVTLPRIWYRFVLCRMRHHLPALSPHGSMRHFLCKSKSPQPWLATYLQRAPDVLELLVSRFNCAHVGRPFGWANRYFLIGYAGVRFCRECS
ncbi:hypothetical protein ERJ75_001577700 [Trypanosoma vivax]|nr:hypothetical protein ERJ75_001577700 [Trypanosoma vivax]